MLVSMVSQDCIIASLQSSKKTADIESSLKKTPRNNSTACVTGGEDKFPKGGYCCTSLLQVVSAFKHSVLFRS